VARNKPPDSLAVRKAIDAGKYPPVWLWMGEEEYLKDELFRRIADEVGKDGMGELSVSRFRGRADSLETILTTCQTLPMLSARRAVLVKNIEKISLKRDRETVIDYVSHPAPETILVLAGEKGPGDPFHRGLIAAGAEPAMFWIPFENQTRQWIQIQFKDHGKICAPPAAEALYERCGGGRGEKVSLSAIAPEIEKIALSMGDRDRVTEDDLKVVARKAHEKLRDQMISRVTQKDGVGALQALDGALLFRENHEVRLVAILAHRLVAIAAVRDWMRTGGDRPAVWPWDEVQPAASRFSDRDVARSLDALASADRTLKSSPKNSRAVLEHTILTICK